jgi:hypothetical protein
VVFHVIMHLCLLQRQRRISHQVSLLAGQRQMMPATYIDALLNTALLALQTFIEAVKEIQGRYRSGNVTSTQVRKVIDNVKRIESTIMFIAARLTDNGLAERGQQMLIIILCIGVCSLQIVLALGNHYQLVDALQWLAWVTFLLIKSLFTSKEAYPMLQLFCRLCAGPLFASILISIPQLFMGSTFFNAPIVWLSLTISLCLLNMLFASYIAPCSIKVIYAIWRTACKNSPR